MTGASPSESGCAPYIFSTILSENQYETKFITRARPNAITIPLWPPRSPPTATNNPVSKAKNSVVFIMLAI